MPANTMRLISLNVVASCVARSAYGLYLIVVFDRISLEVIVFMPSVTFTPYMPAASAGKRIWMWPAPTPDLGIDTTAGQPLIRERHQPAGFG